MRGNCEESMRKEKHSAWFAGSAQTVFNKYVRMRDVDLPCVSCGRTDKTSWDSGHFIDRAACSALRYEPLNVHKECTDCNQHCVDHLIGYRAELIKRIGLGQVLWLEGKHEQKRYTVAELKEIKRVYSVKLKALIK